MTMSPERDAFERAVIATMSVNHRVADHARTCPQSPTAEDYAWTINATRFECRCRLCNAEVAAATHGFIRQRAAT